MSQRGLRGWSSRRWVPLSLFPIGCCCWQILPEKEKPSPMLPHWLAFALPAGGLNVGSVVFSQHKWGCSHHPASDSRAPSCLETWDWGNPSALWALPQCPAHRGAAVLQEHSCLQQDSLGSAACQIPWLPRGCDTAPIAFSPAWQREHKAPSVPGL